MKTYDQFLNPAPQRAEKISKISLTVSAGYIPIKTQVEAFINSGKLLQSYRGKQNYDIPPGSTESGDDIPIDPTRMPGYDIVDVERDRRNLNNDVRSRLEKIRAIKEEKKKGTPTPTPPQNVQPDANGEVKKT